MSTQTGTIDQYTGALKAVDLPPEEQPTAPKLPFTTRTSSSPVFTGTAGKVKAADVKKQATDLASNLDLTNPAAGFAAPVESDTATEVANMSRQASAQPSIPPPPPAPYIPPSKVNSQSLPAAVTPTTTEGTPTPSVQGTPEGQAGAGWGTSPYGTTWNGQLTDGRYAGMTIDQANQAEASAKAAGDKFNQPIASLEEQSRQEQAKALIRGGQAGGLLSSQITGAAATNVGANWIGAGGSLDRLRQEYDQSVADLKKAQSDAIQNARAYASAAAKTGNQQLLDQANAMGVKVTNIQDVINKAGTTYQDQFKALSDIKKLERNDATDTITQLVANGYTAKNLPASYLQDLDAHLQASGMPPGSAEMIFATNAKVKASQDITDEVGRQKAEIDNAKGIVGVLKDIPVGRSINIAGQTYMGLSHGDVKTGTETDNQGRVTAWSFNPDSGHMATTDLGYIGKAADGWAPMQTDQGWFNYNAKTGQSVPLEPSTAQTTWQAAFPNGTQSPFRSKDDPYQGQCGAFVNDIYGPSSPVHVGSSYKEKAQALTSYQVDPTEAQVGDTFLMTAGDTGHIGFVAGIKQGPDGKQIITCAESNMVPPGGGVISTTRTMNLDDPRLKMIARVPTDPNRLPPAGPDSPYTRAAMGQLTIGGRSISSVLGVTDAQQKLIDSTIGLVSKGTLTLDSAQQRLSRLRLDPSTYMDQLSDASAQGHLSIEQKKDVEARTKASVTATQARIVNSVLSPLGYRTDPSVVGYKTARANINRVYAADNQIKKLSDDYSQSNAALDLELADAYVRMATGNAVTENQVETLKNSQGWVEQGQNYLNQKKYGGFLSPQERKQIVDLSSELLTETKKSSDEAINQLYQPALDQYGVDFKLNPDDLVRSQDPSVTADSSKFSSQQLDSFKSQLKGGEQLYYDQEGNPVAADPATDDISDLTPA